MLCVCRHLSLVLMEPCPGCSTCSTNASACLGRATSPVTIINPNSWAAAAGRVRGLKGHRWLVIACDTKIVLQDLASGTSRDVPRSLIESRAPTRLAFLFVHSAYLLGALPCL